MGKRARPPARRGKEGDSAAGTEPGPATRSRCPMVRSSDRPLAAQKGLMCRGGPSRKRRVYFLDGTLLRFQWQEVLFAEHPRRLELLKLQAPWPLTPLRLRVHRNHAFEPAAAARSWDAQFASDVPDSGGATFGDTRPTNAAAGGAGTRCGRFLGPGQRPTTSRAGGIGPGRPGKKAPNS